MKKKNTTPSRSRTTGAAALVPDDASIPAQERAAEAAAGLPLYDWLKQRGAGVLLHPTSLPGDQGIGVFDTQAVQFLDFLRASGVRYWQICPLGPTGYGDSPYQCFSAFAGNPYLIDLRVLVNAGVLQEDELAPLKALPAERVDYGAMYRIKWPLLNTAHARWVQRNRPSLPYGDYAAFCERHAEWLEPYAYYRALKNHFGGSAWQRWPEEVRLYDSAMRHALREELEQAIDAHRFTQYLFFGQWTQVRAAAHVRGVEIIGDVPIFVASDSADAWARPDLFEFDSSMRPIAVAGVPPDYFSADGQLWGNPLYRWEAHAAENYAWWLARMRASFELYDVVRIDHFRGFDTYWRIPYPAENARKGEWRRGPGLDLFRAIQQALPDARIIAEDLGQLTDTVYDLLRDTGLPGMMVLQFAFGGDATNGYLPHHAKQNAVIYPGTHDNDTTMGWYRSIDDRTRDHVRRYLRVDGTHAAMDFVHAAYASAARLAVIPLQDLLELGSEARFNTPARAEGNWQWRCTRAQLALLSSAPAQQLRALSELYGR